MVDRPRLPHLALPDLEEGDEDRFVIERTHDGVEFRGLDLSGDKLNDRSLTESVIATSKLDDTILTGAHLREVRIDGCTATACRINTSQWREVEISGGRFGAFEAYDAMLAVVRFVGVRIDYLNLRGSTLLDVSFEDCHLGELDLMDATVTRAAFAGTTVRDLALTGATLTQVDLRGAHLTTVVGLERLRGATVSPAQLHDLAPLFADEWGIRVE